jgi:hypothetical protein
MSGNFSRKEEIISYKIGWNLERQLTWAGLFLANLLGLFEILLNKPKQNYISFNSITIIDFFNLYFILYIALIFGILITMSQTFKLIIEIRREELELRSIKEDWLFDSKLSPFIKFILKEEKINNHYKCSKNSQSIRCILYLTVFASLSFYSLTLFDIFKLNLESLIILPLFIFFISLSGMEFDIRYNSNWGE